MATPGGGGGHFWGDPVGVVAVRDDKLKERSLAHNAARREGRIEGWEEAIRYLEKQVGNPAAVDWLKAEKRRRFGCE